MMCIFHFNNHERPLEFPDTPWFPKLNDYDTICNYHCSLVFEGVERIAWEKDTVSFRQMDEDIRQFFLVIIRKNKVESI
jgi:hypothetical protein